MGWNSTDKYVVCLTFVGNQLNRVCSKRLDAEVTIRANFIAGTHFSRGTPRTDPYQGMIQRTKFPDVARCMDGTEPVCAAYCGDHRRSSKLFDGPKSINEVL